MMRLFSALAVCSVVLLTGCSRENGAEDIYTINVTSDNNGTASADATSAISGATVTLTAKPNEGYSFEKWTVVSGGAVLSGAADNPAKFTMPKSNVSVKATFTEVMYSVEVTGGDNGTARADMTAAPAGATVTLTAEPNEGYSFEKWTVVSGGAVLSGAADNPATFTMPESDVSVKATFTEVMYKVEVTGGDNGTARADMTAAPAGATVTLTAEPNEGYLLEKWTVVSGGAVLSGAADNPATFTMPESDVSVKATFTPVMYKVEVTIDDSATTQPSITYASIGMAVKLVAQSNVSRAIFEKWIVESGGVVLSDPTENPATFIMPANDVKITAKFVKGSMINGIVWAPANVDAPGTFADNFLQTGMFYQWPKRVGWSSTDPLTSSPAGSTWYLRKTYESYWEAADDPCPKGWRIPAQSDFEALCDQEKTEIQMYVINEIYNVALFRDKESREYIILPQTGYRDKLGNLITNAPGYYWTNEGLSMYFFEAQIVLGQMQIESCGLAIRCVME